MRWGSAWILSCMVSGMLFAVALQWEAAPAQSEHPCTAWPAARVPSWPAGPAPARGRRTGCGRGGQCTTAPAPPPPPPLHAGDSITALLWLKFAEVRRCFQLQQQRRWQHAALRVTGCDRWRLPLSSRCRRCGTPPSPACVQWP